MSKTKQPRWRLSWATDCEALWIDDTGAYPPELGIMEFAGNPDYSAKYECGSAYVYRVACEPCTLTGGVISDNPYHPLYPAWWSERLPDVAAACDHATIADDVVSGDVGRRVAAYRSLVLYFGPYEFNAYPLEVSARYAAQWPRYRKGMRRGKDC